MRLFNAMKSFNQVMVSLILLTISTLSWAQKTVITYIHTDHLGTPVMATHEDGSVKWKNDYQPFGEQVKSTPTDSNVGFTGHLKDKGIGLTYMKGRWYQPESGRFMALDPVWYTEKNPVMSFNRYLYVNNNPYKYVDPDGEFLNFIISGVISAAIDAGVQYIVTGQVDFKQVAAAGVSGMVGLGMAKQISSGAKLMGLGTKTNIAYQASTNAVSGSIIAGGAGAIVDSLNGKDVSGSLAANVLGGVVGGAGGTVIGEFAGPIIEKSLNGLLKNSNVAGVSGTITSAGITTAKSTAHGLVESAGQFAGQASTQTTSSMEKYLEEKN